MSTIPADLTAAVAAYAATPNAETLLGMNQAALPLLSASKPAPDVQGEQDEQGVWKLVSFSDAVPAFREFRAVFNTLLTEEEVGLAEDAISFAFVETVKSTRLPIPVIEGKNGLDSEDGIGETTLTFALDSASVARIDPDFTIAFRVAGVYIFHGSRVRTSDSAGRGTYGTRAVEGIGENRCKVMFSVR